MYNIDKQRERITKLTHQIELLRQAIEQTLQDVSALSSPFPDGMPVHRGGSDPTAQRVARVSDRLDQLRTDLHRLEAERDDIIHQVRAECSVLTEKETQVILFRVRGKSFRQIAGKLGCTIRHAQRIYLIAQKKLRTGSKPT